MIQIGKCEHEDHEIGKYINFNLSSNYWETDQKYKVKKLFNFQVTTSSMQFDQAISVKNENMLFNLLNPNITCTLKNVEVGKVIPSWKRWAETNIVLYLLLYHT